MSADTVRNVIFKSRVEADPSPTAKETADTIRALNDAAKQGAGDADAHAAAQRRAADAITKSGAAYDANASKMRSMFTVIRDGTKNVLAYTALDGQLKKIDAAFASNSDGAVLLKQHLQDLAIDARSVGGDLQSLKGQAVTVSGAVPTAGATGVPDIGNASTEVQAFAEHLTELGGTGEDALKRIGVAAQADFSLLQQLVVEASKTPQGAAALALQLTDAQREAIDLLQSLGAISHEEKQVVEDAAKITQHSTAATAATEDHVQKWTSLRRQIQIAKGELDDIKEKSNGAITPELILAAEKAGELDKRMRDVQFITESFDPEKKFGALTGIIQNAVGGFTSARGAIALFGGDLDNVQRGLLKVESALAFSQGLQQLFGNLRTNLISIRALIASVALTERGLAVSEGEAAVGAEAQAASTGILSSSLAFAKGAATALWETLVANPIGIIVAAIGVLIATIYELTKSEEDAKLHADELLATLNQKIDDSEFERQRTLHEDALANEKKLIEEVNAANLKRAQVPFDATDAVKAQADLERDRAIAQAESDAQHRGSLREAHSLQDAINSSREIEIEIEKRIEEAYKKAGIVFVEEEALKGKANLDRSQAGLAQTEREAAAALGRALINDKLDKDQQEDLTKLERARAESVDKQKKLVEELNGVRIKGVTDEFKAESEAHLKFLADLRAIREANPLAGSIAQASKELERLRKIATEIPQFASKPGVLEGLLLSIQNAEARLKQLQSTFIDDSVERLAEETRTAAAMFDIEAKEAVDALKLRGASAVEITQLENVQQQQRLLNAANAAQKLLDLEAAMGKLSEVQRKERQDKINETLGTRTEAGDAGTVKQRQEQLAADLAALEERKRHALEIAAVDEKSAVARANNTIRNETKRAEEVHRIEEAAARQTLALELDTELERLRILQSSGLATEAEITKQLNVIAELRAKLGAPQTDDTKAKRAKLISDIADDAKQIADIGIQAWRAWSDAAAASIDRQIALQEQRVSDAQRIADKGNATILKEEKKRLAELNAERARASARAVAIAQVEAAANAVVAITKAATLVPFPLNVVAIAATLVGLTAGIIQARQLATQSVPSFFTGGEARWSSRAGYTGGGNERVASRQLGTKPYQYEHREFIMDHDATGRGDNLNEFHRILRDRVDIAAERRAMLERAMRGRVNVDRMMQPRSFVRIVGGGGMDPKQVDRIVNALKEQQPTQITTHFDGEGVTQLVVGRMRGNKGLNNRR